MRSPNRYVAGLVATTLISGLAGGLATNSLIDRGHSNLPGISADPNKHRDKPPLHRSYIKPIALALSREALGVFNDAIDDRVGKVTIDEGGKEATLGLRLGAKPESIYISVTSAKTELVQGIKEPSLGSIKALFILLERGGDIETFDTRENDRGHWEIGRSTPSNNPRVLHASIVKQVGGSLISYEVRDIVGRPAINEPGTNILSVGLDQIAVDRTRGLRYLSLAYTGIPQPLTPSLAGLNLGTANGLGSQELAPNQPVYF